MASSYPSGLDALTNPLPGDSTVAVSHAAQHGNANDAIEAIQAVLGLNPQGGSASVKARLDAADTATAARAVGAASSTDNTLPRFDGTSGKTLQGSGVVVDDSNAVSGVSTLSCGAITSSGNLAARAGLFSGAVSITDTTDSTTSTTGSLKTAGGLGVAKAVNIGTTLAVTGASTFTGDVTISKATPVITASASSTTTASFYLDNASSGSYGRFLFRVGGARRWDFGRDGTAESGANAGSDFYLTAYSDAGSGIGTWLAVRRADGKTTLGGAGASAGLELGSSGPRIMSGTGSPEGVVTAPVGSQWTDTAATTGAVQWIKATGSGNTGWVVERGDTGIRDLSAVALSNSWAWASSIARMRRINNTVSIEWRLSPAAATASGPVYNIPSGFRPTSTASGAAAWPIYSSTNVFNHTAAFDVETNGDVYILNYSTSPTTYRAVLTWMTADAWPSSLPGT